MLKHSLFAAALFALANCPPSKAEWIVEPVDLSGQAGWSLNLDFDSAGNPHAAYYQIGGNLKYQTRSGGKWTHKAEITFGDAFALDGHDDPFFINTPGPDYYPHLQILLDNNLLLGQQLVAGRISENVFLDFDSQNRPQVGYVNTGTQQLKHATWNGAQWITRTVATGPEFQYGNSGFTATLDSLDQMHFAWTNSSDVLRYARPNGSTWQVSSPFGTAEARPYDLEVDGAGKVHLAYDLSTGNVFTGGLFYASSTGGTWTSGRVSGLDSFGAGRTQLVVDEEGAPHLFTFDSTFSGPEQLKHVFQQGGFWTSETLNSTVNSSSGPDAIAAVRQGDRFHVLFSTGNSEVFYAYQQAAAGPSDFDADGRLDDNDLLVWKASFGVNADADADGDGDCDGADFLAWQRAMGTAAAGTVSAAIPEPSALCMAAVAATCVTTRRKRRAAKFA